MIDKLYIVDPERSEDNSMVRGLSGSMNRRVTDSKS